jgi:hypothetical protein
MIRIRRDTWFAGLEAWQARREGSCHCSLGWGSVLLLRHCIATGVFMDIPSDSVLT